MAAFGANLILDFLEEGEADLRSAPQPVVRSKSPPSVLSVTSTGFDLGMALEDAEVAGCDFSRSVMMGLMMLRSGQLLHGRLRLDADTGEVEIELKFDQGLVIVRADDPGAVELTFPAGVLRGDVTGGDLELQLDQGDSACKGLMDFAFTLTGVP